MNKLTIQFILISALGLLLVVGSAVALFNLNATPSTTQVTNTTSSISVAATFYPLAYIAEQVGGDLVSVHTVIPNGTEPHDYTPSPSDIRTVTNADVLLYNGAGLDTWAESIAVDDYHNLNVQRVPAVLPTDADPHVWLDPVRMQGFAQAVADAYSAVDPTHSAEYTKRANTVIERLAELDSAYQSALSSCALDTIISAHDAFSYLADRYNFVVDPIVGVNPNATPSAQTISNLVELVKNTGISVIFFEELTNPKFSEVLASEVGAQTDVLNPLEGLSEEELAAGDDYFSISEHNLEKLALAMRCQ